LSVISEQDLDRIDLGDLGLWEEGPPHDLFARLRREAPLHWSPLADYPEEAGFWSVTRAADLRRVSLDWETFSSYVGGILVLDDFGIPLEVQQQQMISMDPPRHDRLKGLFQRGFTPARIAEHEERIRAIVTRVLDRVEGRERCDLVHDVAGPVVARVIGTFIGTAEGDVRTLDLALVVLLGAAGNDSTRSVFTSGMLGLMEERDQLELLLDDPSLIPGAVEELLRFYPAFSHFRRTATRDVELHGRTIRAGDKVLLWYVSGNRDEAVYDGGERLDVTRNPEHQAFGAGGRHFCLGAALARLELKVLFEETLRRFPAKTLPVRLS
jgi:cytochrome P450